MAKYEPSTIIEYISGKIAGVLDKNGFVKQFFNDYNLRNGFIQHLCTVKTPQKEIRQSKILKNCTHLSSHDIEQLIHFLNTKISELDKNISQGEKDIENEILKEIDNSADIQTMQDTQIRMKKEFEIACGVLKMLPTIQFSEVWFIFYGEEIKLHPQTCTPKNMDLADEEMEEFDRELEEDIENMRLFKNQNGN